MNSMFENLEKKFIEKKPWGERYSVHLSPSCQVDLLEIKKGGYSSRHHHDYKWNRFFVLSGELQIRVFHAPESVSENKLHTGYLIGDGCKTRKFDIKPGVIHEFEAITEVKLLEVYFSVCSEKDIVRKNGGGLKV